ncbi:hypothetical protein MYAM1_000690 [Malassezia yamatoensis]|uniref:Dynein heavy chain, cytoplasmic n=1 Tax=Malassezia yamatoensis TaxID=253288 RepID=A0AAJ5YRN2_9BASI|nr:hypothetical protein MYAM1_000690 [Malassezia yamatoensis]
MDDSALKAYVKALLPALLGVEDVYFDDDAKNQWDETEEAFLNDASVPVVFVDQHSDKEKSNRYVLARRPTYAPPEHFSSVALMKTRAHIDSNTPLASQLRVVSLLNTTAKQGQNDVAALLETPYEALELVVHNIMTPWFDAYALNERFDEDRRKKDDEIPFVKRKFAELELSLRHLQQGVEIPQVVLTLHPVIQSAVESCEKQQIPPTMAAIHPPELLQDVQFVNELHAEMNGWVRAIQKVTKLDRNASSGTAMQEIHFWNAMEHALEDLEKQLNAPGIALTLEVLTNAKRFHATVSFHTDTGIKDSLERVRSYNVLMRDFPLPELLAANSLAACGDALRAIFGVLTKKLRVCTYPVSRALEFVEAISRELNDVLLRILTSSAPMQMAYDASMAALTSALQVLQEWDELVKEFVYIARDLTRKRAEKYIPIKVTANHAALRTRLEYLQRFRSAHQELVEMVDVSRTWSSTSTPLMAELSAAMDPMQLIDALDVSEKGTTLLSQAETRYNKRIAHVESLLVEKLRSLLDDAHSAREQLRILAQCNKLFVRPKIRAAVQEYQQVLLKSVQSDIDTLYAKFRAGFRNSDAHLAAQLRHQPEIVGAIVWANEIGRQLKMYLQRVHDVLGAAWEHYADGQRIHTESTAFARRLDTKPLLTAWSQDVARRGTQVTGPLLQVAKERGSGRWRLIANYDAQAFAFADEAHALTMLGMSIPQALLSAALDLRRIYPFALSLVHALQTLERLHSQLRPPITPLMASIENEVQSLLSQAMNGRWERFLDSYNSVYSSASADALRENPQVVLVEQLANVCVVYEERMQQVLQLNSQIDLAIDALDKCDYDPPAFQEHLDKVQEIIDTLSMQAYPNIDLFVALINERVERCLHARLVTSLARFSAEFAPKHEKAPVMLHVRLVHTTLVLEPSIEHAREHWYGMLRKILEVVLHLPCVHTTHYELQLNQSASIQNYNLLSKLPDDALTAPLGNVESRLAAAKAFATRWTQLQYLWDTEAENVAMQLGQNLDVWHAFVQRLRDTRALVDSPSPRRSFALVEVDVEPAQARVATKLDTWEAELLKHYAQILAKAMSSSYTQLNRTRSELENLGVAGNSTAQIVQMITLVHHLTQQTNHVGDLKQYFEAGQDILHRRRLIPSDWLHCEQIAGETAASQQLLAAKRALIRDEHDTIYSRIIAEDRSVAEQADNVATAWTKERPIQGNIPAHRAQETLADFASRITKLKHLQTETNLALESFGLSPRTSSAVDVVAEEVTELRSAWGTIAEVGTQFDELRSTPWASVEMRTVRQRLDALLRTCRAMPSRIRQFAAYEHIQEEISMLLKHVGLLQDLRSDAFQERHWRALYKQLAKRYLPSSQTLGQVWDLDWRVNLGLLRSSIEEAQGQYALELYLQQVREAWSVYALDLVNYRNECMLIHGFDALFQLAAEHASGLRAMSASPHYRIFEEDALRWEERITRIQSIFDLWMQVQRQFVYLNGIFTSGPEIKRMLPMESNRFQSITAEFMTILRRLQKAPYVLEVIQQPGLESTLERLAELLHKIQTALGEYLERERVRYPRFFFVGDDDLLEMLGNRQDIKRVASHLHKMFAGIRDVCETGNSIEQVVSHSGDVLTLTNPVSLTQYSALHEWLAALERSIADTLKETLAKQLKSLSTAPYLSWVEQQLPQIAILSTQVQWARDLEEVLYDQQALSQLLERLQEKVKLVAESIAQADRPMCRTSEHILTLLTHHNEVTQSLLKLHQSMRSKKDLTFAWEYGLRHYFDETTNELTVRISNATFTYGFEFLDVGERLVQTPLTSACFAALTQALQARMGGAPFGPAGTGKTETVKALANELGRLVFVFNCDNQFDGPAMARILAGLCRVGAWGCFDEFNRLNENVLSSVSQQIQAVQNGFSDPAHTAKLNTNDVPVHPHTGIFVTMNPNYAGRSHLPENLKQLFRSIAMTVPDLSRIVYILLLVHGFQYAQKLAHKIVLLFDLCSQQVNGQDYYDFGLRALKAVLRRAAYLRRNCSIKDQDRYREEQAILVQSIREIIPPKLILDDLPVFYGLVEDMFPKCHHEPANYIALREAISSLCRSEDLEEGAWSEKIIQLYQMQQVALGILIVGPAASGKTLAWKTLLKALERVEKVSYAVHVLEPKVWSREHLWGTIDVTTREWFDGLFTRILRRISENSHREKEKRHWIIFDGDIDPEWVENLNSVLDDNQTLTLPTGERLAVPQNVRVLFEVESIEHATLATITRCGMVAFSSDLITRAARLQHALTELQHSPPSEDEFASLTLNDQNTKQVMAWTRDAIQRHCVPDGLIDSVMSVAHEIPHIMEFDDARGIKTLFALLRRSIDQVLSYNARHIDFPMTKDQVALYSQRALCIALVWACAGDTSLSVRQVIGQKIQQDPIASDLNVPMGDLVDYYVDCTPDSPFRSWAQQVVPVEVETSAIANANTVIPTLDTVRQEELVHAFLMDHRPVILCGPPGSGKTMVLTETLKRMADVHLVGLNLSSQTTSEAMLRLLEEHCSYEKTVHGTCLVPRRIGQRLVVFCDEINLPSPDAYSTQPVISFLRQLVEQRGFWRKRAWVLLDRVQFVGACNPPTDPGRTPLSLRFLRHAPVLMVDYPSKPSLYQIYQTLIRSALRTMPNLLGYAEALTTAMVNFYTESQRRFTAELQAHYIYSPRELTRWVRGLYRMLRQSDSINLSEFVRMWAYEGLRLFQDRLVLQEERQWTDFALDDAVRTAFPSLDVSTSLQRPILYSDWLSKEVRSVDRAPLRHYAEARITGYSEEELETSLVLHDSALDLALSCDRVLQQKAGHLLLIGVSGSGRSTIAQFCAWLRGLTIFALPMAQTYRDEDFDEDLRRLLRRVGVRGERVCWTMDEGQIAYPARLEKINTLLANADVPGLFEGEEHTSLLSALRDAAQRENLVLAAEEELLQFFRNQILSNLHVVLTMNPPEGGVGQKATTSPALFNRCTLVYCW